MIQAIFKSIKTYSEALALIKKLKLWKYFVVPILISVFTFALVFTTAYSLSDDFGNWLATIWPWKTGRETFALVSGIIGGVIMLIIGLLLYKHIILALSAPFMSPVSEKIEFYLTGSKNNNHRKTSFVAQLWRGISLSLRNLSWELLVTLPIVLLKFMVPLLAVLTVPLLYLVQSNYAGFGNMDYTLERHYNYKDSIAFIQRNRGYALGNGIVFIAFLFVPLIGVIFILPMSVTAASITTVKLLQKEGVLPEKNTGFEPFTTLKA